MGGCPECCNGATDNDPLTPFYVYFKDPPFQGGTLVCNPTAGACPWTGTYTSGGWRIDVTVTCTEGTLTFTYDEYQWTNGAWVHATGAGNHGLFSGPTGPIDCEALDFPYSLVIGGVVMGFRIQGKASHDASGQ